MVPNRALCRNDYNVLPLPDHGSHANAVSGKCLREHEGRPGGTHPTDPVFATSAHQVLAANHQNTSRPTAAASTTIVSAASAITAMYPTAHRPWPKRPTADDGHRGGRRPDRGATCLRVWRDRDVPCRAATNLRAAVRSHRPTIAFTDPCDPHRPSVRRPDAAASPWSRRPSHLHPVGGQARQRNGDATAVCIVDRSMVSRFGRRADAPGRGSV